ncbi:uncharacterized protein LOC143469559 [Clavelina lepadiformis]|uniref:uncharacterized protein LOC143469559 n=1 Tax=Clavelina lepadiformis TaxID=159417 RepID=UPI00404390EB
MRVVEKMFSSATAEPLSVLEGKTSSDSVPKNNSTIYENAVPSPSDIFIGSRDVCITTQEISLVVNVITICVGLIIILGNLLVVVVIYRYPSRNFTALNWLLCHLATADLAIGLTVFWWFGIAEILLIPFPLQQKVIFYGFSIVCVIASFEGLLMIAVDRYLLILHQRSYRTILTKKRLILSLVIMWVVPMAILVAGPVSGWSCVKNCDCRIHNMHPDDIYCFGENCSQILPPLTKQQLLIASVISLALFLGILVLYVMMFKKIQQQSKKLQAALQQKRISQSSTQTTTSSISTSEHKNSPTTEDNQTSFRLASPTKSQWRHNLATLPEMPSESKNKVIRFSSFNKAYDFSDENDHEEVRRNAGAIADNVPNNRLQNKDAQATNKREAGMYIKINPTKKNGEDGEGTTNEDSTVEVRLRPRSIQTQRLRSPNYRKSVTQSVVSVFSQIKSTRKAHRHGLTNASRKRDVRVMRAMFTIMTVFVVTTTPLMIFMFYTFFNNDRSLKEIFNYLFQVITLNSMLNPFLYFWRIPHLKAKLYRFLRVHYRKNSGMLESNENGLSRPTNLIGTMRPVQLQAKAGTVGLPTQTNNLKHLYPKHL